MAGAINTDHALTKVHRNGSPAHMASNTIPPLREYELFLKLLAEKVYAANLRDSIDFKQWLLQNSERMRHCHTLQEFFDLLP
jgi:hypothetical protein